MTDRTPCPCEPCPGVPMPDGDTKICHDGFVWEIPPCDEYGGTAKDCPTCQGRGRVRPEEESVLETIGDKLLAAQHTNPDEKFVCLNCYAGFSCERCPKCFPPITDAEVEVAAKAINMTDFTDHRRVWKMLEDWEQDNFRVEARAALEAAREVGG